MKKLILLLAVVAFSINASAQRSFHGNKFLDNWFLGINGGVATKTTDQSLLSNLNPNVGLRLGKWMTPYFGVAVEGNAYFNNKVHGEDYTHGTAIKVSQVGVMTLWNINNIGWGYKGFPRKFEVFAVTGFTWGHNYKGNIYGTTFNHLDTKFALDFNYNFGGKKEDKEDTPWQLYIEPAIYYIIAGVHDDDRFHKVRFDSKASYLQLNIGLNYKFMSSNFHHNFTLVEACDERENEARNEELNNMRAQLQEEQQKVEELKQEVQEQKQEIEVLKKKPVQVITEKEYEPNLPAVFYQLNKSVITPAQQQNVAIAAEVLKKHPEFNVQIKGYASPEGPHDNNTSLGIRRANAVKDMLVKKYGISPSRITAEGCGETDELFEIFEFNRVAMLYLQKNK